MGLDFIQNFQMPTLNDEDQACLTSCMDEIRNVVGESVSERQLVDTIMKFKFDFAKSLDAILNASTTPPTKSTRLPAVTTSIAPTIETGDTQHLIAIDIWKQHAICICIPNEMVHLFWFSFFFSCFFFYSVSVPYHSIPMAEHKFPIPFRLFRAPHHLLTQGKT